MDKMDIMVVIRGPFLQRDPQNPEQECFSQLRKTLYTPRLFWCEGEPACLAATGSPLIVFRQKFAKQKKNCDDLRNLRLKCLGCGRRS